MLDPGSTQREREREGGREGGILRQNRWKRVLESFGGALSKARVETPSLSKYYLRQPPRTAARGERGEESH